MAEINILDSSVFNRIAAGEVVESPSSVVKELIENSIDALAAYLKVEIFNGGIDKITVTDDGKGLGRDDLKLAFLPHATSKIKSLDDLNKISSLGFRGEALPSIASVSEITFVSKRVSDDIAYGVTYKNGVLIDEGEQGSVKGSVVTVKDLFLNVPARRKFLKKPGSEAAKITDIIKKQVLANPNVAFEYFIDGERIYCSDGKGIDAAAYTIFGNKMDEFFSISGSMPGIILRGFVSRPTFNIHNRSMQHLIVNGRAVENDDLSYSVYLAYKEFLMTKRYPCYIIYLTVPLDLIDINISPAKTLIKFADSKSIGKFIYFAIRKLITEPKSFPSFLSDTSINTANGSAVSDTQYTESGLAKTESPAGKDGEPEAPVYNQERLKPFIQDWTFCETPGDRATEPTRRAVMEMFEEVQSFLPYKIIGVIFETYIVIQYGSDIFLIDQHAAHERILFDLFLFAADNGKNAVQELLAPYVFSLPYTEAEAVANSAKELQTLGFNLSRISETTFSISSVPSVCSGINLDEFVRELFSDSIKALKKSDFMRDKIASAACKAAVKAGDILSDAEILSLLKQMRNAGTIPLCPHGRPIIVKITRAEVDKWFKRIV